MQKNHNALRNELKPLERRLKTLDEHIKQAGYHREFLNIHKKYERQKPKNREAFREAHRREITLFETADRYLKDVLNGHEVPPVKAWISELVEKTAKHELLSEKFTLLKEETRKVERIKRSVDDILQKDPSRTRASTKHERGR
jgi:hypothetical protein